MTDGIELLAPAGGKAALRAAVQSGADAVYIGGPMFNARGSADNFTIEEIKEAADYCHLYGADLHVAVNTLIKERELDELIAYARELNRSGADALIIQDLGAAKIIRELCPDMPLHASTQMTVTSAAGARVLEKAGFSRIVLARELTQKEIARVAKSTSAEIEVFVHGALCMCYSGQCLMSAMLGGRSANRGRCAQPCRLPYTLTGGGANIDAYALSPKDLSLIGEIDAIKRAGVKSLKIEGRLKRPEYVSAVTGIYRKYLDSGEKPSPEDLAELENAFSRSGFTKGFFGSDTAEAMMSHKNPGNVSGNIFTDAAKNRAREDANIRKIPVKICASLKRNDVLRVTMTDNGCNSVTACGADAETALKSPIGGERLKKQLKKLGQTPFCAEEIYIDIDDGITVPVSQINETRRNACAALIRERQKRNKKREGKADIIRSAHTAPDRVLITAECETAEQVKACADAGADIIYADEGKGAHVIRTADIFDAKAVDAKSVTVSSSAAADFYKDKIIYVGPRMNVFNSVTAELFKDAALVAVSPELNLGETRALIENTRAKCEVTAYGRLTLMLMKNCPVKALGRCQKHKNIYYLRDRKSEEFPILCAPSCAARLINSKPIFTADKIGDILSTGADALRLIFTTESAEGTGKIVRLYKEALSGRAVKNPFGENKFTRGHYYRGVE